MSRRYPLTLVIHTDGLLEFTATINPQYRIQCIIHPLTTEGWGVTDLRCRIFLEDLTVDPESTQSAWKLLHTSDSRVSPMYCRGGVNKWLDDPGYVTFYGHRYDISLDGGGRITFTAESAGLTPPQWIYLCNTKKGWYP